MKVGNRYTVILTGAEGPTKVSPGQTEVVVNPTSKAISVIVKDFAAVAQFVHEYFPGQTIKSCSLVAPNQFVGDLNEN